ncbi:MAG: 4'-phosphopantetheinyl transferase superfamily protein [Nitrospirae bacterium]|nr:4'-phosphopantetheinyl transferase superfamily protein [Nitrospirota bacterium]
MISRIGHWMKDILMLKKVFTDNEIQYCLNKRYSYKHLAIIFAAKEAFMKAIGTGWSNGIEWKDIEVINKEGVFSILLYNKAKELCYGKRTFVSTSCSDDLAIAIVTIADSE